MFCLFKTAMAQSRGGDCPNGLSFQTLCLGTTKKLLPCSWETLNVAPTGSQFVLGIWMLEMPIATNQSAQPLDRLDEILLKVSSNYSLIRLNHDQTWRHIWLVRMLSVALCAKKTWQHIVSVAASKVYPATVVKTVPVDHAVTDFMAPFKFLC